MYRCLLKTSISSEKYQKNITTTKIIQKIFQHKKRKNPPKAPGGGWVPRNDFLSLRNHRGVQMKVVVLEKLQQKGQQRHCLHPSRRLKAGTFPGIIILPTRELTYPTWGKPENHRLKYALSGGYVNFLEGTPFLGESNHTQI